MRKRRNDRDVAAFRTQSRTTNRNKVFSVRENWRLRRILRRILVGKLQLVDRFAFHSSLHGALRLDCDRKSSSFNKHICYLRCGGTHTQECDGGCFEIHHLGFQISYSKRTVVCTQGWDPRCCERLDQIEKKRKREERKDRYAVKHGQAAAIHWRVVLSLKRARFGGWRKL